MTTIAVDIDNTLYSFEDAARQAFLDLADERSDQTLFRGAYNPWGEWRSMMDTCGDQAGADVIARVHAPEVISKQRPFQGARDVLWTLVEEGYAIKYISNRDPASYDATEDWIIDFGLPYHRYSEKVQAELICTMDDKIKLVSDCQYIIDDRPKTLVQFIHDFTWRYSNPSKERLGFGLAFPFNQNLTDIPRISLAPTWSGIRYYLEKKGVLDGQDRHAGLVH